MTVDYTVVVGESKRELEDLLVRKSAIETRIREVVLALRALAPLVPAAQRDEVMRYLANIPQKPKTLTEAVIHVLKSSQSSGLTSSQIRQRLEHAGFDLGAYSQPLGAIFTTLQRLIKKGKVFRSTGSDDTIIFKLK